MCGIAGFFSNEKENKINLKNLGDSFCKILDHRGPDDNGIWIDENHKTLLAHTRLSILDLDPRSKQPMIDYYNNLIIVFNGEIYNWRLLKIQLQKNGYKFKTESDTEVLLKGFHFWKENILNKLEGMFSFGIYNYKTKELFCARDRIGKKPFVYSETQYGFIFSSEIPAITKNIKLFNLNLEIDDSSIFSLFGKNFRQISEPNSIFKEIKKIKPGHGVIVKDGKIEKIFQWWEPIKSFSQNVDNSSKNLRNLLEEAVIVRCKADVEVGAFLSGGVDSSSISYIANKQQKNHLKTYALGLDKDDDDLIRARSYSKLINSDHKEYYFDPIEEWSSLKNISKVNGEPLPLLPLVHAHYICQKVKEDGIKVMLSGIGADELFFGYTGMVNTLRISIASKFLYPVFKHFSDLSFMDNEIGVILSKSPGSRKSNLYRKRSTFFKNILVKNHLKDKIRDYNSLELDYWGSILPNKTYIDESSYLGLILENSASVAISGDIPAMMHGIEVRCPFLDNNILEYAFNCHWNKKINPYFKSQNLKKILRDSVNDIIPENLLKAPKRGFGYGIDEKSLFLGPWKLNAQSILNNFPNNTAIDPSKVRNIWKSALEKGDVSWDIIMKLVSLGTFLEESGLN